MDPTAQQESSRARSERWRRADFLWMLTILVLGAWLRVRGLADLGIHSDEAIFISVGGNDTVVEAWRNSLVGPHPPANYLMLHWLTRISWSPWWLKLGAVLGGTLSVAAAFAFGRELLGRWAGVAMAWLVAFSPALVELSRVARNYAPGYALVLLSFFFLARYFNERRTIWLVAFAAAELLAATWHYTFISLFLGANVAVASALWQWRAPIREWVRAVAVQLPLAAFYLFAYVVQVAPNRSTLSSQSQELYRVDYALAIEGDYLPFFLAPFREVLAYVATPELALPGFALAIGGAILLAFRRRWPALLLLVGPLPFAFGLQLAGISPIGGTRHSAFLFVSLFALVAVWAGELPRSWQRGGVVRWGLAGATGLLAVVYTTTSLAELASGIDTRRGYVVGVRNITALETPTRMRDIERIEELLTSHVDRERDIVLLSYNSMLVLHVLLAPGPMRYAPDEPVSFDYEGIRFFYAPSETPSLSVVRFREALEYLEQHFGVVPQGRVWVPQTAWELYAPSLTEIFRAVYRGARWDRMKIIHHKNEKQQPLLSVLDMDVVRRLPRVTREQESHRIAKYVYKRTQKADWGK